MMSIAPVILYYEKTKKSQGLKRQKEFTQVK